MNNLIGAGIFACVIGVGIALALPAFAQQSVAGTSDQSVSNVTPPSGKADGSSADTAVQAFQSLSPEERNALLQQAIETFKSMPPEQRQALTDQAKAMGGDAGSFGSQWDKLLTPDQKKMLNDQLQSYVKNADQQAAPQAPDASGDPVAALTQQVQNLTPEQKQALIRALGGTPPTATAPVATPASAAGAATGQTDSCTPYQNANPSFYALCESRMHPAQK